MEVLSQHSVLNAIFLRLSAVQTCPEIRLGGQKAVEIATNAKNTAHKAVDALHELVGHLQDVQGDVPNADIPAAFLDEANVLLSPLPPIAQSLQELVTKMQSSGYPFILRGMLLHFVNATLPIMLYLDEYKILVSALEHFTKISDCLRRWSTESTPFLSRFTRPVLIWLESKQFEIPGTVRTLDAAAPSEVIDSLLLSIQSMLGICNSIQEDQDEERENYLRDDSRLTCRLSEKLGLGRVLGDLELLLKHLAQVNSEQVQTILARVLPFLERYLVLVDAQVSSHANWSKALFKLNYTLGSIVRTIAKDGFCQPKDTEGAEEGGEGQETMEDTGLGEGTGSENMSKEIQEESQVEGLQGEEGQAEEKIERAEEGNAIEMSEDFGGEMQDVPEAEDEGEGESEEEGSEADPDEQIGDVDPTGENAVDEKLWGDEQGPEDKEDSGKTNQDHSKQQTGQSEMVAREGEQSKSGKNDEVQAGGDDNQEQPFEEEADVAMPDEEPAGADGAPMDEHVQEADTLDLPENIKMDHDTQEQDASDDMEDDLIDEEVGEENIEQGRDEVDKDDPMGDDDQVGQPHAMLEDSNQPEGTAEDTENDAVAQADTHAGDGKGTGEEAQSAESSGAQPDSVDSTEDTSKGQQGPSATSSGEQIQTVDSAEKYAFSLLIR